MSVRREGRWGLLVPGNHLKEGQMLGKLIPDTVIADSEDSLHRNIKISFKMAFLFATKI